MTYVAISYVISLRGSKGFLLDLRALRELKSKGAADHFWLSLSGQLKAKQLLYQNRIPYVNVTLPGIKMLAIVSA